MELAGVEPDPTPEEMAAIVAALDVLEHEMVATAREATRADGERWRFSGRWWSRPMALRRDRP